MPLDGTAITDVFYLINPAFTTTPTLDLPRSTKRECCSNLSFKAFGDINSDDEFKNDIKAFMWYFDDVVNVATLTLTKFSQSTGEYEDIAALDGSLDLGNFFEYGFFVNGFGNKFIRQELEWKKVLYQFGSGSYIVRVDAESGIGDTAQIFSDEYCLKQYTPSLANGTIRIDYLLNGIMGDSLSDINRRDFGSNQFFYDSLRWNGYFTYVKSTFENEYTRYNSGARKWIKDEQEPEFKLLIKQAPWAIHEVMRTDILQADEILITDYNMNNFNTWIKKSVQKTSEYPPRFYQNQSKLASVELTFRQAINNLQKLRS